MRLKVNKLPTICLVFLLVLSQLLSFLPQYFITYAQEASGTATVASSVQPSNSPLPTPSLSAQPSANIQPSPSESSTPSASLDPKSENSSEATNSSDTKSDLISDISSGIKTLINKLMGIEDETDPNSDFKYKFNVSDQKTVYFQEKSTNLPGFALEGPDKDQIQFTFKEDSQTAEDKAAGAKKTDSTIEFPVTIKGISMTLRYTVEPGKVKEDFIINQKPTEEVLSQLGDKLVIPFNLSAKGFTITPDGEGYLATSASGESSWQLVPPIVTDAKGNQGPIKLDIPLPKAEETNLSVDSQFLKNAVYPVVIDPTVVDANGNTTVPHQRHVVKTSDGTLHAVISASTALTCGGASKTGILWLTSTDLGTTWTCQAQLINSSTPQTSIAADALDNIYVVGNIGGPGSTSADITYQKLTRSGNTWTPGTVQTALDSTLATTGYGNATVEVQGTSRVWIAARYYNNGDYNTMVAYSNNQSDAPTWTETSLTSTSTTNTNYSPVIIRFGTKLGVFYALGTNLLFRYRDDADAIATWNAETTVITGSSGTIGNRFTTTVDNNNILHVAAHTNNATTNAGPIRYAFFNGTSWSTDISIVASAVFGASTSTLQLVSDGTSIWLIYPDRTGLAGPADIGRLAYKKAVSPFGSGDFDASPTGINSYEKVYDKVWSYNSGGDSYVNETTDAGNTTTGDVTMVTSIGDILYLGMLEKYRAFNSYQSVNGIGGVLAYEYWNGSTWTTLTTNGTANSNLTSCTSTSTGSNCGIWFNPPSDWATTTVNGEGTPYYYVRARVTTAFTTTPVGSQLRAMAKINNIAAPVNIFGGTKVPVLWNENINTSTNIPILSTSFNGYTDVEPDKPSSLGPTSQVDGSVILDNTPQLDFTLSDPDGSDTVKYRIQVDNDADYSSPLIDYTSALAAQGATSFTVGQSAGSGTYTTGSSGQSLGEDGYYWRVKAIDNSSAASGYTLANSGNTAFSLDSTPPTAPGTPTTTSPTIDTTPTWTWTAATDDASGLAATPYTFEWSTDNTFNVGVSSSTSATNSFTHVTPLALGTWYFRVKATDVADFDSDWSTTGSVQIVNSDNLVVGTLSTVATFNSISVYAPYTGDNNSNGTAILEYKKSADSTWIRGMDMTVDRRATVTSQGSTYTNDYINQFRASVLMVDSNTPYDIRVTFSDPDNVIGGSGSDSNQATGSITTKNENITTGTGLTYYVAATGGSDSNDGLSVGAPFATIQKAANVVNAGDVVLIRGGTYTSASAAVVNLIRSGNANAYIDFQSYPGETAIIDASSSPAVCGTGTGSSFICGVRTNASYIRFKGLEIIGGNIGIKVDAPSTDVWIDGNSIHDQINDGAQALSPNSASIMIGNNAGGTENGITRTVIQNNTVVSATTLDSDARETSGLISFWSTSGNHIVRNNHISYNYDGVDNRHGGDCVAGGTNAYINSGIYKDSDVYNNTCIDATDDGFEVDGGAINVRVWGNTTSGPNLGISIAPVSVGPAYIFRNTFSGFKYHWTTGCGGIKSGEAGTGDTFLYQNTFYGANDDTDCTNGTATYAANGSDGPSTNVHLKNNVMLGSWRVYSVGYTGETITSDYNVVYQANQASQYFAKWRNVFYTTFELFKAGSGLDTNSIHQEPQFLNGPSDLHLRDTSPGVNQGTVITGFNDSNSYWPYIGSAPDIGAFETSYVASTDNGGGNSGNNSSSSSSSSGPSGPSVCSAPSPTQKPDLFQATATNNSTTLYVTAAGRYNKYQVIYGYTPTDQRFVADINVDPNLWIVPITINQLAANTTYYFKVKAINDCTPGEAGNTLAIRTTGNNRAISTYFKSSNSIQQRLSQTVKTATNLITKPVATQGKVVGPATPPTATIPAPANPPAAPTAPVVNQPTSAPSTPSQQQGWLSGVISSVKKFFGF